jgi:hypothetical protein
MVSAMSALGRTLLVVGSERRSDGDLKEVSHDGRHSGALTRAIACHKNQPYA